MPNASFLSSIINPIFVGAGLLMLMDASFNVGMEPFRALIADNLSEEQHNQGFSIQTSLIGIGAILGSLLPYALANWFEVPKTAEGGKVPDNVLFSFYAGSFILLTTVLWTVFNTKEFPPDVYASFHPHENKQEDSEKKKSFIIDILSNIIHMPKTMRALLPVQFFTWYAFFSMWVFMTPAIAANAFHIKAGDSSSESFNNAGNWVDILFTIYNATSTLYALMLPKILSKVRRRKIHAVALVVGGISLISLLLFIINICLFCLWLELELLGEALWQSLMLFYQDVFLLQE
jgi:maltose/moltooligosaccharide transporter